MNFLLFFFFIWGVVNAEEDKVGYHAAIFEASSHLCGGAIIGDKWVVTLATRLIHRNTSDAMRYLTVTAGSLQLYNNEESRQIRTISRIHIHPQYNNDKVTQYNVALLQLEEPFEFTDKVYPVALPRDENDVIDISEGIITGFGSTLWWLPQPGFHLKIMHIYVVESKECAKFPHFEDFVNKSKLICIGAHKDNERPYLKGDAGGPLVQVKDMKTTLYGLVLIPLSCQSPEISLTFNTNITDNLMWIKSTLDEK